MMRIIFTRYAKQELEDAIRYYELEYSGLGKRFKEESFMPSCTGYREA